jgi:hypothetical protein
MLVETHYYTTNCTINMFIPQDTMLLDIRKVSVKSFIPVSESGRLVGWMDAL